MKKSIPPGVYHYISPPEDPRNYRLHLRVEVDGDGILIINASTILHLNITAVDYAYQFINNNDPDNVASDMVHKYDVDFEQAKMDYLEFIDNIQTIIETPDLDPITYLDLDRKQPFSGYISSPYRIDLALTYELPTTQEPESAPIERVETPLSKDEWIQVIKLTSELGIPHIVFTGGEPTLFDGLPELLELAEKNNQVTGLLTDGYRLLDKEYRDSLLITGLDHLMVVFHPLNDKSWQVLQELLKEDLYIAVHLTITDQELMDIRELIDRFVLAGIHAISLSITDPKNEQLLQDARNYAADTYLDLIWNLPVPYSASNPVALETSHAEHNEGAGRAWLYIEPDGDVLPSQGLNKVLGNILQDPWEQIWNNSLLSE